MLILSPSILAADFANLSNDVKKAEAAGADYFHFDVMDGLFVPNISFGFPVLEAMRKITKKTLDVHLMIENPARYIKRFKESGADIITVHQEACVGFEKETIEQIHALGLKAGIAIKPHTDVAALYPLLHIADMFLVMTVEPGFGGQSYMNFCTGKVMKLRDKLFSIGRDADIQVDGGITRDNFGEVVEAGANVIVMGSSVFKGNITENMEYFNSYRGIK